MLPRVQYPTFSFTIPSTGQLLKFRPYSVGEEKTLLMALESEDFNDVIAGMKSVISACVQSKDFDIETLSTFDIELFFLHLKSKSSGEEISISLMNKTCLLKEGKGPCEKSSVVKIDLKEVKAMLTGPEGELIEFDPESMKKRMNITLSGDIGVILRFPSFSDLEAAGSMFAKQPKEMSAEEAKKVTKQMGEKLAVRCIVSIYTKEAMFRATEIPEDELLKWYYDLPTTEQKKIEHAFDDLPEVKCQVDFKCQHCDFKSKHTFEGISDFFA